jgi:outer membrane protein assembly factor BamB
MRRFAGFVAVGLAVVLALPASASTPAVPIPGDPLDALMPPYVGAPARPQSLGRVHVPEHPFMARNGASNIHDDAYQSDVYAGPGPLGRNLQVTSTLYGQECASVTFDRRGRIVTVCPGVTGATLRLIDPTSLAEIASYALPARPPGTFSFTNFSGGGYFYLDRQDRAVVATFTGHLLVVAVKGDAFELVRDYDLTAHTGGTGIQSALPDWSGRIWFVTVGGRVGVLDPKTGAIRSRQLAGEVIANSFAIDESGGVFVASDHALYRFDARGGAPVITWRQVYDRGTRTKPGQVSQGSGTTPTLIDSASSPGGGSIAITDNADPYMHVVVYRRGRGGPGKRLCNQAIFPARQGSDENSLISVPGGLIAENNYGYTGPAPTGPSTRAPDTVPGLVRVDVDYRRGGCRIAWSNTTARVPSLVSKVSLRTGLLYAYTHPTAAELDYALPTAPVSWFLPAFDARTGRQVWSRLVGSGLGYNNNYAPVSLGADGTAYVGTLGGLVRIADG